MWAGLGASPGPPVVRLVVPSAGHGAGGASRGGVGHVRFGHLGAGGAVLGTPGTCLAVRGHIWGPDVPGWLAVVTPEDVREPHLPHPVPVSRSESPPGRRAVRSGCPVLGSGVLGEPRIPHPYRLV
jgi:hypothetical protein